MRADSLHDMVAYLSEHPNTGYIYVMPTVFLSKVLQAADEYCYMQYELEGITIAHSRYPVSEGCLDKIKQLRIPLVYIDPRNKTHGAIQRFHCYGYSTTKEEKIIPYDMGSYFTPRSSISDAVSLMRKHNLDSISSIHMPGKGQTHTAVVPSSILKALKIQSKYATDLALGTESNPLYMFRNISCYLITEIVAWGMDNQCPFILMSSDYDFVLYGSDKRCGTFSEATELLSEEHTKYKARLLRKKL